MSERDSREVNASICRFLARLFLAFRSCGCCGHLRWSRTEPFRHSSKILRGRGQQELVFRSAWPAQSKPVKPENSFEVREEHLDLLALLARLAVGLGVGK